MTDTESYRLVAFAQFGTPKAKTVFQGDTTLRVAPGTSVWNWVNAIYLSNGSSAEFQGNQTVIEAHSNGSAQAVKLQQGSSLLFSGQDVRIESSSAIGHAIGVSATEASNATLDFRNSGNVDIVSTVTGTNRTHAIGYFGKGTTLNVGNTVNQFNIQVNGSGYTESLGGTPSVGATALYLNGDFITVSSKQMNLTLTSGQNPPTAENAPYYAPLMGIRSNKESILNVSEETDTTIAITEQYSNAIGIGNLTSKINILGNVAIDVKGVVREGADTDKTITYGLYNAKNSVKTVLGSVDKTVSIVAHSSLPDRAVAVYNGSGGVVNIVGKTIDLTGELITVDNALTFLDGQTVNINGKVKTTQGSLLSLFGTVNAADLSDVASGTLLLTDATLKTGLSQIFEQSDGVTAATGFSDATKVTKLQSQSSGCLNITDTGEYTNAELLAMSSALTTGYTKGVSLKFSSATLKSGEKGLLIDRIIQGNQAVAADAINNSLTVNATGGKTLSVSGLDTDNHLTMKGSGLTLTGGTDGEALITNEAGQSVHTLDLDKTTLNVGSETVASNGVLPDEINLKGTGAKLDLVNTTVKGGTVSLDSSTRFRVGNSLFAAKGFFNLLRLAANSSVDIDPDFTAEGINGASVLAVDGLQSSGTVNIDPNAIFAVGASEAQTKTAFALLAANNTLSWGDQNGEVGSLAYFANPTAQVGTINIGAHTGTAPAGINNLAGGLLMINQATAGSSPYFDSTVNFEGGALGIINASEGSLLVSNTIAGAGSDTVNVITDNHFVSGRFYADRGTVEMGVNSQALSGAVASMGLQQTAQRADQMLAASIADRTSLNQDFAPCLSLWTDVAAENTQADRLDNGGQFKSDMGYGTFGADVGLTDTLRAGGALQYAKGTVRSAALGLHNDVQSVGLAAYASLQTSENSRLVADLAYTKGSNDVASRVESKLNQSVDTSMVSLGVSAQYRASVGAFTFTPSVGARVSQLKTDAVHAGAVRIDKTKQTVVQVPLALRVTAQDVNARGWTIAPSLNLAYVPTFGDKDVRMLNTRQTVLDTSPVQAELGMRAQKGNLLFNANVLVGGGSDGTSRIGGKLGIKYVF